MSTVDMILKLAGMSKCLKKFYILSFDHSGIFPLTKMLCVAFPFIVNYQENEVLWIRALIIKHPKKFFEKNVIKYFEETNMSVSESGGGGGEKKKKKI